MSRKFTIETLRDGEAQPSRVTAEFSTEEWDQLLRFASYADDLAESKLVREGTSVRLNLKWKAGAGLTTTSSVPDKDDLAALLHRMRPMVLKREPTFVPTICNVLARRIESTDVRSVTERIKGGFTGRDFQSQMRLSHNGNVVNCASTLYDWLNAFEYHRDLLKRNELRPLDELLSSAGTRALFVSMLLDQVKAIMELARLIRFIENGEPDAPARFRGYPAKPDSRRQPEASESTK